MTQTKKGDIVRVHYTGKLADGTVFDSSMEREPLEVCIGQGMVVPGFDKALIGMNKGDTKTVKIPPEEAYGNYVEGLNLVIKKEHLPPDIEPQVGMMLHGRADDGENIDATITKVRGDFITLDANHPFAGKTLTFEIQLVDIG